MQRASDYMSGLVALCMIGGALLAMTIALALVGDGIGYIASKIQPGKPEAAAPTRLATTTPRRTPTPAFDPDAYLQAKGWKVQTATPEAARQPLIPSSSPSPSASPATAKRHLIYKPIPGTPVPRHGESER